MKKHILILVLCAAGATLFAKTPPGKWPFAIDFQWLPSENSPAWIKGGSGEAVIENGKLRLRSNVENGIAFTLRGGEGDAFWDGSRSLTIQFRARVIESLQGDIAAHVSVRTGELAYLIPIRDTEEHTYHFLIGEGTREGRLFIDGVEQSPVRGRPLPDQKLINGVTFGDLGGSTGGETEWSDFRWTTEGAFEP